MNKKNIVVLAMITLLIVIITVLLVQRREAATNDDALGAIFFHSLEQKLNDIATVEIVQGKERVTLQRDGDIWRIKEKGGYAADFEKLKPLVLSIANLRSMEAKTTKVDQYDKLGVTDPEAADAEHPGVILKDAKGTTLAALVIGDARDSDDVVTGGQDQQADHGTEQRQHPDRPLGPERDQHQGQPDRDAQPRVVRRHHRPRAQAGGRGAGLGPHHGPAQGRRQRIRGPFGPRPQPAPENHCPRLAQNFGKQAALRRGRFGGHARQSRNRSLLRDRPHYWAFV